MTTTPAFLNGMTNQQLASLCTQRERWLAVEAGAGAGKTHVLSARLVLLLEAGVALERIVAITFTRKAAFEMGARVLSILAARIKELRCELAGNPADAGVGAILERLEHARAHFHRKRIETIDAFCRAQLAAHAPEIPGIEPGFAVLDEHAGADALDDALERCARELSRSVAHLEEQPDKLDDHARKAAAAFALLNDWLTPWQVHTVLERLCVDKGTLDSALTAWNGFASDSDVAAYVEQARRDAAQAMETEFNNTDFEGRMKAALKAAKAVTAKVPDDVRAGVLRTIWECYSNGRMYPKTLDKLQGGPPPKPWKETGFDAKEVTVLKNLYLEILGRHAVDDVVEERSARLLGALAVIAPYVRDIFNQCKRGALDFGDLTRYMRAYVRQPGNAARVAATIDYLMVDEFQDTDPEQWEIFQAIVKQGTVNLFVVGDRKQSIYRFRGADVSVFSSACAAVVHHNTSAGAVQPPRHPVGDKPLAEKDKDAGCSLGETSRCGVLRLSVNFRSAAVPLRTGNLIFDNVFGLRRAGEEPVRDLKRFDAPSGSMELSHAKNHDGPGHVDVLPFAREEEDGEANDSNNEGIGGTYLLSKLEAEAVLVAQFIKEVLTKQEAQGGRGVALRDIAVLAPTHRGVSALQAVFATHDIPYCVSGGQDLYRRQECYDLCALLTAVGDRDDDLAVLGVLRSPFCGVSDNGLALLVSSAGTPRKRSLYSLWRDRETWPASLAPADSDALADAYERFSVLVRRAGRVPLREFIASALTGSGAWAHGVDAGACQRAANLRKLMDMADAFEGAHGPDIAGFADHVREAIDSAQRETEGQQEDGQAGVTLTTIHAAKGREFDAVILPFLPQGDRPPFTPLAVEAACAADGRKPLIALAPGDFGASAPVAPRPYAWRALDDINMEQRAAELRRLLYVGWTRAKRHLVLTVPLKKPSSSGANPIPEPDGGRGFTMLGALLSGLGLSAQTGEAFTHSQQHAHGRIAGSLGSTCASQVVIHDVADPSLVEAGSPDVCARRVARCRSGLAMAAPMPACATAGMVDLAAAVERKRARLPRVEDIGSLETDDAGRAFGRSVHAVLERMLLGDRTTPDELARAASLRESVRMDKETINRVAGQASRAFGALGTLPPSDVRAVEMDVGFLLGDEEVPARLDVAWRAGHGHWVIVDYKTGSAVETGGARRQAACDQLARYAVGLRRRLLHAGENVERIETALLFTESGRFEQIARYGPQELEQMEAKLAAGER